jgi:HK97 family phage major capsid protein
MSKDILRTMALDQAAEHMAEASRRLTAVRRARDTGPRVNIARMISDLGAGRSHGEDREALEEHARRTGASYDPQRPQVPLSAFQRALTVAGDGELVGLEAQDPRDILRPWSVTARAGVQVEFGLVGNQVVPVTSGKATPAWFTDELTGSAASTPTIAQRPITPHTAGAVVNFSRQLSLQANAEAFVSRELLRTVGTAVDQAVIAGSGADGEPQGLIGTDGVGTQAGTSLAYAGVLSMKRKVADANAPDEAISYIGTAAVRELLEARERAAGNGFIWDDDKVASRPARVSTDVPAATLIAGAFEAVYLGIWGDGITVEINPHDPDGFKSGVIRARVLVSCDVAVVHPGAFVVATSIT